MAKSRKRSKKKVERRRFQRERQRPILVRRTKSFALLPPFYSEEPKPLKREVIIRDKPNIRINQQNFKKRDKYIVGTEIYRPDSVAAKVCKNRRERREIMFATRKAGKGRSGPKRRKYTEESKVRC